MKSLLHNDPFGVAERSRGSIPRSPREHTGRFRPHRVLRFQERGAETSLDTWDAPIVDADAFAAPARRDLFDCRIEIVLERRRRAKSLSRSFVTLMRRSVFPLRDVGT
jgi:hypothetical protein